jgi:hypothetical protein
VANYFSNKKVNGLDLKIIPVKNGTAIILQNDFYPNISCYKKYFNCISLSGMGLLEGLMLMKAAGTDNPFIQFGAPWINAEELHAELNKRNYRV